MTNNKLSNKNTCPLSSYELSEFCEQILMMINSGIMLYDGIDAISKEIKNKKLIKIFSMVADELRDNNTLDNALKKTNSFPNYMISVISLGIESGTLDKSIGSLAKYYKRDAIIKDSLKSAILYPSVMITIMFVILLFLSTTVLPIFREILMGLGTDLSPIASSIIHITRILSEFAILLAVIALVLMHILKSIQSKNGLSILESMLWQTSLYEKLSISIFSSSMATTLSSGIDIIYSLELSKQSIYNKKIINKINIIIEQMDKKNESFEASLKSANIFSNLASTMILTGINSGNTDYAMNFVAEKYESNFEGMLVTRISLIEPVSVAIMSCLIGTILISVLLPLFSLISVVS